MNLPRLKLAQLPTPIEALSRLSASLNNQRIMVKRDDLTGIAMGGNKIRKLEFVLADALAHGAKTLVTVGALQSNHCRQTAAIAARLELGCTLVLSGLPPKIPTGNLLLDGLFDAKIVWSGDDDRNVVLDQTFEKLWLEGKHPYKIPLGASTPIGVMGYVQAFNEFITQEIHADWIIHASSSAGTQAGLILGAALSGWKGKILGISVDLPKSELMVLIQNLIVEALDRLGNKIEIPIDSINVNDDYIGMGYGEVTHVEMEAISLFARREGLILDPVYTGRAAGGMIDLIQKGFFKKEETILFWHTGGTPALFAEQYQGIWSDIFKDVQSGS